MSTAESFIGRSQELVTLKQFLQKKTASLLVVNGVSRYQIT